jgi:hypothetical protein
MTQSWRNSGGEFVNIVRDIFGIQFLDAGGYLTRHMFPAEPAFEALPNRTTRLVDRPKSIVSASAAIAARSM